LQVALFPAQDALLALALTAASRFEPAVKNPKLTKFTQDSVFVLVAV
jgi:hypothetical protein